MRVAISLLVLLLSMCEVQTESHGTDASTQDVSTELKELRDMVVELRATLQHTQHDVKVLEAGNVAGRQRLAVNESMVEALERALQDTKAEMKTENAAQEAELTAVKTRLEASEAEVMNLKRENAAQEAELAVLKKDNAAQETELIAVKTRLAATETEVENVEKEIRAAPKVAFSAGLERTGFGFREAGSSNLNVVFKVVITNVGEAFNSTTGFFTAPVRGVYYFRFTVADMLSSRSMLIRMHKNGELLMQLWEYDTNGHTAHLSSGLTLQLEQGDVVNMVLPKGARLWDNHGGNHCTFSGFLLFPL